MNGKKTKTIIRAVDYLPEPQEVSGTGDAESFHLSRSDSMLINLFGAIPDYSNKKFEKLWQEVFDVKDMDTALECFRKGAEAGDMRACYAIYETWSNGVSLVSEDEAMKMCRLAASRGHEKAAFMLKKN